jgi:hypothetical protein
VVCAFVRVAGVVDCKYCAGGGEADEQGRKTNKRMTARGSKKARSRVHDQSKWNRRAARGIHNRNRPAFSLGQTILRESHTRNACHDRPIVVSGLRERSDFAG